MPPKETTPTKDELEVLWQGASRFARECAKDHEECVRFYGRNHSITQQAWRRFDKADKERKEAQKRWETAN